VLETASVALDEAAQVPFRLARARAQMEGLDLRSALAPGVPPVSADMQLLQRVILNLIFFAMAWADASQPVRLASEAGESGPVLSVEWAGDPVPAHHLQHVFDPDTQARLWKELGRRSVGIGLAFCKVAVEAMRGRMWLESARSGNALKIALPPA
jgi:K+-sensing histidine kinase KdpD